MAKAIGCQSTYVSRVLREEANFSLEQGEKAGTHIGLLEDEMSYLYLLIQRARAGSKSLETHFLKLIETEKEKRSSLQERLSVKEFLEPESQQIYYSNWIYAAVHVLLTIKGLQNRQALSNALNLPMKNINEVVDFLIRTGLVNEKKQKLEIGKAQIHLPGDSFLIYKHHVNWRIQAINSIEKNNLNNLHYSSVISVSKELAEEIREEMILRIKDIKKKIKTSDCEVAYGLCFDFFNIFEG